MSRAMDVSQQTYYSSLAYSDVGGASEDAESSLGPSAARFFGPVDSRHEAAG